MTTRSSAKRPTATVIFAALALALALPAGAAQGIPIDDSDIFQYCLLPFFPVPTGVTDRPPTSFNSPYPDYYWLHSSTHLQGEPTVRKYAPGLFYQPPGTFSDMRSIVMVNNGDPAQVNNTVTVQFFDTQGTPLVPTTTMTLQPEQSMSVSAAPLFTDPNSLSPGLGSAQIVANQPIVGATIHHAYQVGGICDPDPFTPGLASMQQLQRKHANKTTLLWGAVPTSTTQTIDFLNGILPMVWVQNPNAAVNNITITYRSRNGVVLGPIPVALQPNGSVLDLTLFNALVPVYLPPLVFDDDFSVTITSTDGLPLIGDGLMLDVFGPGMGLGTRFRMGSTMLANTAPSILVNPELTYQVGNPAVTTINTIWNTSNQNIGPLSVRYRDRNGAVLGVDTYNNFAAGRMLRIGPGLGTPNYPGPGVFDGWVQIVACKPGLVGVTMREVAGSGFQKVFGETLHGTNNREPGSGFPVTVFGTNMTRKVSPVGQVWDVSQFYWPGTESFVNDSAGNIGAYYYQFHDFYAGTNITNFALQPFAGVRWGATSFTYEDPETFPLFNPELTTGRVDHTTGVIKGIDVIGDPLIEYGFSPHFIPPPTCSP